MPETSALRIQFSPGKPLPSPNHTVAGNTEHTGPIQSRLLPRTRGIPCLLAAFLLVFFQHYASLPWGWSGVINFFVLSGFPYHRHPYRYARHSPPPHPELATSSPHAAHLSSCTIRHIFLLLLLLTPLAALAVESRLDRVAALRRKLPASFALLPGPLGSMQYRCSRRLAERLERPLPRATFWSSVRRRAVLPHLAMDRVYRVRSTRTLLSGSAQPPSLSFQSRGRA